MSEFRRSRGSGFTLIELLVVVAIIALLISILLPSLAGAREQAKIAKCLSNLRSVGQAGLLYLSDQKSGKPDLPWALPNGYAAGGSTATFSVYSETIYGGNMPNKTNPEWQAAFQNSGTPNGFVNAIDCDVYKVRPKNRPLNRFIAPEVTWDAPPLTGGPNGRPLPADQNEIFLCPSDAHPVLPWVQNQNPLPESVMFMRTFDWWGTSYPINWYWPYYYYFAPPGNQAPYTQVDQFLGKLGVMTFQGRRIPSLGSRILSGRDGGRASEFVLFTENGLNYALEGARPFGYTGGPWTSQRKQLPGFHGRVNKHAAAFLDGHAAYMTFDTRNVFGTGWTVWPGRPWAGIWGPYSDRVTP